MTVSELLTIGMLAAVFTACLISLAWKTGVTVDEPAHFLSGRLYWEGRDNLRPGDVPPLMKIVSGWVPLVMHAPLPPPSNPAWANRDEWMLALGMMEGMSAAAVQRHFFAARLPMLLFPIGCCLLLWWWGRQLFSPWPALGIAALFCLSPTVLGHGALVKNDLAASFGYLLFWYRAWRFWLAPGARNAAWLGVGVLAGVLAKFSLAVLLVAAPLVVASRFLAAPKRSKRGFAFQLAACAGVVWVGMLAAWQFRIEPISFKEFQAWKADARIPKLAPKAIRIASVIPMPGAFWRGGMSLVTSNDVGATYFLGQTVRGGHPLYFLVALAVKAPVSSLALFLIALSLVLSAAVKRRLRSGDWCWLLPGFLYLALASFSGLQLGVRLVLPAIVFFLLACGKAFQAALSSKPLRAAAVALILLLAGETANAYPNYIPYFNLSVRDPLRGLRIVSDSNIDWGQGLRALRAWYAKAGIARLNVAYFGTENVFAYFDDRQIESIRPPWSAEVAQGITRLVPSPGYYAISATLLSGQLFPPAYRDYFAAFRSLKPSACVAGSIFIYRIP